MALPLGKLTILVGAGILGSVLAKEGRLPDVSNFVSGAFKIAFRQLKQDDSTSSVSKSSKPPNDSLIAQVNSLRQELQMLASSRPVTIVTANGTGANKYGAVVVVVVVGYGYVWWKGWKLPDMMFATRRSLSDACTSIAQQLENVYASIRSTRRHLSSKINDMDSNLNAVAELTASTQEKVIELREDSSRIGNDVRYVRDAVETLELKISRIEGKQDLTTQGVKRLCDYASNLENNLLEENIQTSASSSRLTFSSKAGALPAPSSEPSTPALIGSQEVQRPPLNAASASSQQRSNGISVVAELVGSLGISNGIHAPEETSNGTSWFKPAFLMRTRSATNKQSQGYLHPESCILLGGVTNFRPPDIPTMLTASGNTINRDAHLADRYDGAMFYGMPQYHSVHPHPQYHGPNLDLSVATAPNFYVPYMTPSSGIPISHASCDQLSSPNNYGVIGVSSDEYGINNHFMDNARSSYKRKNAEGNPGNFHYLNASASSSSSDPPLNTRHPEGVALMDVTSFTPTPYRGASASSIREVGPQRSVRNRLGAVGLDPALTHNPNHFIQGNYLGQPYQPGGSLWLDQHLSNGSTDAGASGWTQNPTIPYMHGNNVNGGPIETGSMGLQRYLEPASNRSNASFSHPSPANPQHHNFHHLSPPIQGSRGRNINTLPQAPAASFRVPTANASQSTMNLSQDGLDIGLRNPGSVQPTGLRMYRPHHEGVVPETTLRHRNLPHLRVLPTDGVAILGFPDYYEVENYVDHHRDMRMDIEDMSYEELLALGDRIGNVNTGLSDATIRSQLKTRTFLSSPYSFNWEVSCIDQEADSCIICQDYYKSKEKIASLDCGHEYHANCLKKWLRLKNVCPICKSEALAMEGKDV